MAVSFGKRLAYALSPMVFKTAVAGLFASCRIEEQGRHHYDALTAAGSPFVLAFWHYTVFMVVYHLRAEGPRTVAMVSSSDDAEFVSRILQSYGTVTVRGSRNRRGLAAMKEMMALMRGGRAVGAIVADGSQGPALEAQPGAVLLASRLEAPILPVTWAADRYIAFSSWDRTLLPKPGARIVFRYGEPLTVPAGLRSAGLEEYRVLCQQRLRALYNETWAACGHPEGHYPEIIS